MRRVITLTQVFLLVSFYTFCQEINLTWGRERKFERSNIELGYVGRIRDHFYTLRKEDKVMYLSKTRISDMSQIFDKPIKWSTGNKSASKNDLKFSSFRLFKDYFIFYFTDISNKEDIERLYAQKLDFEGNPVGDMKEIGRRPKLRRSRDGNFEMSYSPDSTHFLVTTNPSFEKYNDERFYFKIFNSNLEELHNAEVTLPFKDKDFGVKSITLDNNKIIHVLAKVTTAKRERKDDEASYYYEIVSVDPKQKGKAKEFEVKLDKRYVDDVDLILDKKGNLKCFGFYADMKDNGKRKDGIHGVFYFSVVNGQISNASLKEFDAKLVLEIEGKKRANRNQGLESTFSLNSFFEKPDGGLMVLAEESYLQVITVTTSNGTSSTHYHYYYNSVLAVNINPKGNIIWYAHVPKKQHLVDDGRSFGSFHAMYVKDKIYLVYNDEESNAVTKTYEKEMRNYMKCVPVMVTINEAGKSDKKIIGNPKSKKESILKPKISDKISDSEAFFYADRMSRACCVVGRRKTKTQRFGILAIK